MKIALSGNMGSGKTTLAHYLCQHYPFVRHAFADQVKWVAREVFDMREKKRELLIQIGNKMREIDADVWVNCLLRACQKDTWVVVDDLRYPNEWKALQQAGFITLKLDITPHLQQQRLRQAYPHTWQEHWDHRNHWTEHQLADSCFDQIIKVSDDGDVFSQVISCLGIESVSDSFTNC